MIRIYDKNEKMFNHNGLKILKPLKAVVVEEDNGDYYLEMESFIEDKDVLVEGNLVRVDLKKNTQTFRISNVEKKKSRISLKAKHIYFDSKNYIILDTNIVDKDLNDALDQVNMRVDTPSPFETLSDITLINSTRIIRKTLEEAVSILIEKWGGHLVRDNQKIEIRDKIGKDTGIVVSYGKNLKELEVKENWDSVVTKLYPVGRDGIMLPEEYLTSSINYEIPYTKVIKFDQDINEDEYKNEDGNIKEEEYKQALIDNLRTLALYYLEENQYFKANYKMSCYLEEDVSIGDEISVYNEKYNINLKTNVISTKYDAISNRYIEIEFGNFRNHLKDLIKNITDKTDEKIKEESEDVKVTLREDLETATSKIWGTLGSSYVIYEGDRILVVDKLPKEEAENVMMINSGGIGFSNTGIDGTFNSAWLIDGTLDMQVVNAINLSANLVKGGTFKIGSKINEAGRIEIYDVSNRLIGVFDEFGIQVFGADESRVVISPNEFTGYDSTGNKVFWMNGDEFHMKKAVVGEEITLCEKARWLGIETEDSTGVGIVPLS